MKILEDIYIIGGGNFGIGLSHQLDCNAYLIDCGDEAVLIDSGVGRNTKKILQNIEDEGIDLKKIKKLFLTHVHLDHSGGAKDIKLSLNPDIFLSEIESQLLENSDEEAIGINIVKKNGVYPKDYRLNGVKVDRRLKGWEKIKIGKYELTAIPTPGHSKGSICFLLSGHSKKVLFTGDTVFLKGLLGLLNLPDSSLEDYREGIKNLKDLGIDSLMPGHYGFTINNGQFHINLALRSLEGLAVPPTV